MHNTTRSLFRFCILLVATADPCRAHAQNYQYAVGGDTTVEGYQHIVRSADSNSLYVIGRAGPPFDHCDVQVARITTELDTLWTYRHRSPGLDFPGSLCELSNGDIIAVGTITIEGSGQRGLMIRLTPAGDTLWTRVYMQDPYNGFHLVERGPGDTLIVLGVASANSSHLQQFNAAGDPLWAEPVMLSGYVAEHRLKLSGDTIHLLSHYQNYEDIVLTQRRFSTGTVLGSWHYEFAGQTSPADLVIEADRILILAAQSYGGQPWFTKMLSVDHNGTVLDSASYRPPDPQLFAWKLLRYSSGYLICGHSEYVGNEDNAPLPNIAMLSISAELDSLAIQYYGTELFERMKDVTLCNGSIYGCGVIHDGPKDLLVFRIDTVDNFVQVPSFEEATGAPLLFPNPTPGDTQLNFPGEAWTRCDVMDMQGKILWSNGPGVDRTQLASSSLSPGVYMVRLIPKGRAVGRSTVLVRAP